MVLTNQNFEKFKNPEDIHDIASLEDIKREVDAAEYHIELDLSDRASLKAKETADAAVTFCGELSKRFKESFLELLELYQKERKEIPASILKFLRENKFDLPHFKIVDSKSAKKVLGDLGYYNQIGKNSLLIVFNLPKPLAHFWWKDRGSIAQNGDKDPAPLVIEWGDFYRAIMPLVWNAVDSQRGNLELNRINAPSEHDPKSFYYLWEAELKDNL